MVKRAALLMILYAAALVGLGLLAFFLAPPTAKATTAIAVPAVCALLMVACGVAALTSNATARAVGVYAGVLLPLIFAVAFFLTGENRYRLSGQYRYIQGVLLPEAMTSGNPPESSEAFFVQRAFEARAVAGAVERTPEARAEFERRVAAGEIRILDHDPAYLARILFVMHALSVAVFIALLMMRPRPNGRGARPEFEIEDGPRA